jgi:hypothetical protein
LLMIRHIPAPNGEVEGLTFDMSGTWKRAQPAVRCPLDGGVRPHAMRLRY